VKPIAEQIEEAKARVSAKVKDGKYIAYFQSFTNTYGDVEYLREIFSEAIKLDDIVALSIGTRPDCLSDEVLEMLSELNRVKPVWVELGLQTIHEETAKYIRRGYPLRVYDEAVSRLKKIGVDVIVHVILGLPGETVDDMRATVDYVVRSGADGIKLQLLHVLKGTDLCRDYEDGKFEVMDFETYVDLVSDIAVGLPDDIVVHRLTGDGPKKLLVAPLWSGDKKRVLNAVNKAIKEKEEGRFGKADKGEKR
jgi:radical SAM protein (TIGR01212 family)